MSNRVEELNYSGAQCLTEAPHAEERSLSLGLKGDGRGFSNTFHLVGSGRGFMLHPLSTSYNSVTKHGMGGLYSHTKTLLKQTNFSAKRGNAAGMFWQTVVCTCCMMFTTVF